MEEPCPCQTDRAVQLLLETSADNQHYYCDALKACLVTTVTSSGPSQSTIKLVATNMIASGKLAGKRAGACSPGPWEVGPLPAEDEIIGGVSAFLWVLGKQRVIAGSSGDSSDLIAWARALSRSERGPGNKCQDNGHQSDTLGKSDYLLKPEREECLTCSLVGLDCASCWPLEWQHRRT